ncbi:MAG: hypothetical protein AAF763_01505 [Pseudomonadota bacterium]
MTDGSIARSASTGRLAAPFRKVLEMLLVRRRKADGAQGLDGPGDGRLREVRSGGAATSVLAERSSRDVATRLLIEDLRRRRF